MSIHPHVQARAREEILHHFPHINDEVTYDKLGQLDYLDMVIKETLRLAPSVGTMIHKTKSDVELEPGVVLPKGMEFVISSIALHRLKRIWGPDVDLFNPDRFSSEESKTRHPYSFIPFSAGPRNCLGYKYAQLSVKTILVYLLRYYRFTTPHRMSDLKFGTDVAVHLEIPYHVAIERVAEVNNNNNNDIKGAMSNEMAATAAE